MKVYFNTQSIRHRRYGNYSSSFEFVAYSTGGTLKLGGLKMQIFFFVVILYLLLVWKYIKQLRFFGIENIWDSQFPLRSKIFFFWIIKKSNDFPFRLFKINVIRKSFFFDYCFGWQLSFFCEDIWDFTIFYANLKHLKRVLILKKEIRLTSFRFLFGSKHFF